MHVLALANRADPELGLVGERLVELGASIEHAFREDEAWLPSSISADVVVSLGSEWSVYDPALRPPVDREADTLRASVAAGIPVLGICFGAQLLSYAFGGRVVPADLPEIGWSTIEPREGASLALPAGPYLQWHRDRFEPPPTAEVLAGSPAGCQAFRLGIALGVQFHPEATTPMIERWATADRESLGPDGLDGAAIVAETAVRQTEARIRASALVDLVIGAQGRVNT